MAKFDWDKFEDETPAQAEFDWSAHPEVEDTTVDQGISEYIPSAESLYDSYIGAGQGLTAGGGDEGSGLVAAGLETMLGKLGIGPSAVNEQLAAQGFTGSDINESFLDKYRGYQEAGEAEQTAAAERSPIANTIGQIGGGVLGSVALGGVAGLNQAALQGPKALFGETLKNQGVGKAALDLLRGTATTGSRLVDAGAKGLGMYAKAAPFIAGESALSSKENIIGPDSNIPGVLADVAGGQLFGAGAMMGMGALPEIGKIASEKVGRRVEKVTDKLSDAISNEDNPRLRRLAQSYGHYGEELGISPRSAAQEIKQAPVLTSEQANDILQGRLGLGPKVDPNKIVVEGKDIAYSLKDRIAANQVHDIIDSVGDKLGKKVGDTLDSATEQIDIDPIIQEATTRLQELSGQIPAIAKSRKSAEAASTVLLGGGTLTPRQLKNLIDDVDYSIGVFKRAAAGMRPGEPEMVDDLYKIREQLSKTLKDKVPSYRGAAEQFQGWREVVEQLIAGSRDPKEAKIFFGDLKKGDQNITDALIKLIGGASSTQASMSKERTAFTNFMNSLGQFEALDVERAKRGLEKVAPSTSDMRKFLIKASDDANVRNSVRTTSEARAVTPDWREWLIGKAPESGAYLAGKTVKSAKKIAEKPIILQTIALSKAVYNAPAQSIANLASKLETSGSFSMVGKALREAVENGDSAKKNAALFTIMQNPNSRAFISAEDFPDADEE